MKIDYTLLKKEILGIDTEGISIIFYNERGYYADLGCTPDYNGGMPAEWFRSTRHSGADVYIWSNIEPEFKRAMDLHEIIEADLKMHQNLTAEEAHKTARKYDSIFAKETMNPVMLALFKIISAQMEIRHGILRNAD